jgi:hypothetical protein
MRETLASNPDKAARSLYLFVGPCGDMPAGFGIVEHARLGEDPIELCPAGCVPFEPAVEVRHGREQVAFAAVACVVRKDKVMAEVAWIAHPGDEVVDVSGTGDSAVAIEAAPGLDLRQANR